MNPKHCIIDDFYVEEIAEHGQVVAPPSGRSPQLCLSVFIVIVIVIVIEIINPHNECYVWI